IEVDTNPEVTITGLDADTQYDVYVKAVCDEDFESEWIGPETFTTSVVSIGEHTIEGFKLYPNPTKNRITISAYNSIDSVVFYNLLGQEILVLTPKSVQYQIDMTGFEGGMYLIKIISDNKTETHRIIKM